MRAVGGAEDYVFVCLQEVAERIEAHFVLAVDGKIKADGSVGIPGVVLGADFDNFPCLELLVEEFVKCLVI